MANGQSVASEPFLLALHVDHGAGNKALDCPETEMRKRQRHLALGRVDLFHRLLNYLQQLLTPIVAVVVMSSSDDDDHRLAMHCIVYMRVNE